MCEKCDDCFRVLIARVFLALSHCPYNHQVESLQACVRVRNATIVLPKMLIARVFLALSVLTLIFMFLFATLYSDTCALKANARQYILLLIEKSNVTDSMQRAVQADPTKSPVTKDAAKITFANTTLKSPVYFRTQSTLVPAMDKHNFTSMPQWEFEDLYRLDPQFKQSECITSLRNSSDPEFTKTFIPNIQLFLQSDHLNVSEWNRLYHFNNPFGYMGMNYTAIKAAVDTIPKLNSTQLLPVHTGTEDGCIRCAVVGTSGILNGSRQGAEIDSNHYVFRL